VAAQASKNTEEKQLRIDQNRQRKLQAVQAMQRMLHLIDARDFTGTVEVVVYVNGGKAGKIRSRIDQFDDS